MELLKDLELVEVVYNDEGSKATMTFLDMERGEIREVNFNKKVYRDGKFVADDKKAEEVEKWCQEYFGVDFNHLTDCLHVKKDVYGYDNFNSLWKVDIVQKFTENDVGEMIQTKIKEIKDDETSHAILIRYEWNGEVYQSKMAYNKYMPSMKVFLKDPIKQKKQYAAFEEKFGVDISEADKIIGKPIIVEVKSAFGRAYYGEVKPFPKKRK